MDHHTYLLTIARRLDAALKPIHDEEQHEPPFPACAGQATDIDVHLAEEQENVRLQARWAHPMAWSAVVSPRLNCQHCCLLGCCFQMALSCREESRVHLRLRFASTRLECVGVDPMVYSFPRGVEHVVEHRARAPVAISWYGHPQAARALQKLAMATPYAAARLFAAAQARPAIRVPSVVR